MFVQVALDGRPPVGKGGGGMLVAPDLPRREGKEVDVVVDDTPKGGVDCIEPEGTSVL